MPTGLASSTAAACDGVSQVPHTKTLLSHGSFLWFLCPTDNTSCSGGTRMMNPCFLGLHSAHEFLLLSYSCQSTKAPLSRHSNAPFGCQKSDRLLFIALFTIFSQTLWVFLFLQQNKHSNTLLPFHFKSLWHSLFASALCSICRIAIWEGDLTDFVV